MFNPSKDDVRRFFCETWKKSVSGAVLTPLEAIACDWIRLHPEYENDLADSDQALAADYDAAKGKSNPFLHLAISLPIFLLLCLQQIEIFYRKIHSKTFFGIHVWDAKHEPSLKP